MNDNKTSCAPADNQQTLWDRIDWTEAELAVRKLQARIVKAQKEGRTGLSLDHKSRRQHREV